MMLSQWQNVFRSMEHQTKARVQRNKESESFCEVDFGRSSTWKVKASHAKTSMTVIELLSSLGFIDLLLFALADTAAAYAAMRSTNEKNQFNFRSASYLACMPCTFDRSLHLQSYLLLPSKIFPYSSDK